MRRLPITAMVSLIALIPLAGCSSSSRLAGVSDMADPVAVSVSHDPKDLTELTGTLAVANPDSGPRACLTLLTEKGEYALESAEPRLEAEVWQRNGSLDVARSGVVASGIDGHDPTVVVTLDGKGVSAWGTEAEVSNPACPQLKVFAFVDVSGSRLERGDLLRLPSYALWRAGTVGRLTKDGKRCLVLRTKGGPFELHLALRDGRKLVRAGKPTQVYGGRAEGVEGNCGLGVLRVDDVKRS